MSHYSVAVFIKSGQDIGELLAPFDENLEVEPYVEFTRQEAIDYARKYYDTDGKTDDECWEMVAEDSKTDAAGNIYSTRNPDAKWDWWCVGGRYSGMLRIGGACVDQGRVKDIEFPFDDDAYKRALRFWDVYVEKKPAKPGEEYSPYFAEEYYREHFGDRETYAKYAADFSTYAVITPDGKWHSPGEVGWFGTSSESGEEARDWYAHYRERFIESADGYLYVVIVDCHI